MAEEKFQIKITLQSTEKIDSILPKNKFNYYFNGEKIESLSGELSHNLDDSNLDKRSLDDLKSSGTITHILVHELELDDDIKSQNIIRIENVYDQSCRDLIVETVGDPEYFQKQDYGFHIKDVEINEISLENLIWNLGNIECKVCEEHEYSENGFIQSYIIPEGIEDQLYIQDGFVYWHINGDFLNMENSHWELKFNTPLYVWLLELLLH